MKREFIGCVPVALVVAVLACAQAVAGELPSQGAASAAVHPSQIQPDSSGLTVEQAVALATIEPGAEDAYGRTSDTVEMIVLYTVILAVVVGSAILAVSGGL
jgi:hypothetical protein